jgi:hypothetical protein
LTVGRKVEAFPAGRAFAQGLSAKRKIKVWSSVIMEAALEARTDSLKENSNADVVALEEENAAASGQRFGGVA